MTTATNTSFFVGAVVLILGLGLIIRKSPNRPHAQIALSCLKVSTSSNTSVISIGITNQSHFTIVYLVGPAQAKSNAVWNYLGQPMAQLAAGASTQAVVTTSAAGGESRVPVLWGFTYTTAATRWQEVGEDAIEFLRIHNRRGRGALYTNFVEDIKL